MGRKAKQKRDRKWLSPYFSGEIDRCTIDDLIQRIANDARDSVAPPKPLQDNSMSINYTNGVGLSWGGLLSPNPVPTTSANGITQVRLKAGDSLDSTKYPPGSQFAVDLIPGSPGDRLVTIYTPGISIPQVNKPKSKFKEGDRVCLVLNENEKPLIPPREDNPFYPEYTDTDGNSPIMGIVNNLGWQGDESFRVDWYKDGKPYDYNGYELDRQSQLYYYDEFMAKKKVEDSKPIIVNLEILKKVKLPEDKMEAIVSVLKQSTHQKKIFEEWGLGETIEYGRGMTMLFHGVPGTGKTYCANKIAESLGKKLMSVTTAEIQSSTPGEAERNIMEAFAEATKKKEVLLFDECDSLLYNRNNVGMIIGSEINCLLREIEKFEGVCILTTNRVSELDEALERRLSLILKFPEPDAEMRKAIWEGLLPKKLPLAPDVKLEELYQYELTGGLIKNVILNAARYAAADEVLGVEHKHFKAALTAVARGQKAFSEESHAPTPYMAKRHDFRRG